MCEFLVKAVDATNKDSAKDKFCYKRGDAIECLPDGAKWGTHDGPPLAEIIKIPGMSVDDGKKYLAPAFEGDNVKGKIYDALRRRRFSFDLGNIPKSGKLEDIKKFIIDKKTGKTE